ncbi:MULTISPECIES: pyruvate flavodoxin/ferredoxin oxidoreductase [unclassified Hydrogenobaculum]|jgi:Pyruvate:ferredoxin oxidoreductase and related 2-oxoacid:ferredoxin oxidoreductases, alpha subunit|uniref:pyruvate flavodoxin/ferredoxin oxidoreductase n=1 Tax=unclassified Hydrogenobaculum TaxID=2622382 RepID=UPI0001C52AA4|nr:MULTISPECIES: pyruvate flavodoxin/ferredoxin oxidoreductase [unclassified Hydrogenobaculum]AEF18453.1 Pyruvate synthase [Hydrogenobaculum sp. 3684]AEG45743.1 Pyruvate synthase [Hydrogenobaculum sp. SHO]AGG14385.1 pyruvate flavodoxin/ferredoxin oxidoreductase domain protein [Hydrogenobaculum sp. HO]AGH92689.1 2-oxoacid:ferredoxin oxidoreductase, alpha subunit [Hydrogenobaculum sp. SN]
MPEQKVVEADYLLLEAPREKKFITGSQAMAEAVKRANVDIAIAYPITPQSETMHLVGDLWAQGYLKDYYRAEEEYGAMSAIAGAVRGGARAFTATSGPGLLRGIEAIASWPGHRIPAVLGVLTRVVNAPLSIQPDNVEISYLLNCGMVVLHAENQQDVFDFTLASFVISEMVDVYLPIAVCTEGFFVTHAKGYVNMTPEDMKLPPRDPYKAPVPPTDCEIPPARIQRDAPVQKSNFMSYLIHQVWQQEVWSSNMRAMKYIYKYLNGPIEVINPEAEVFVAASGCAAAQAREAVRYAQMEGLNVGLLKIKSIVPFPSKEVRETLKNAKAVIVPEHNIVGWLSKEIKANIQDSDKVIGRPRVYGGMTLPVELIMDEIYAALGIKKDKTVLV